jgi:hypothetical protein
MRGVRDVNRCLLAALVLSGCMRTAPPSPLVPGDTVLVGERWL